MRTTHFLKLAFPSSSGFVQSHFCPKIRYIDVAVQIVQRRGVITSSVIKALQNDTVTMRRTCTLKGLAVYLNEHPISMIKGYLDEDFREAKSEMEKTLIGMGAV